MTDIKKKTFEELTPEDCKELKIQFAPGCFDNFEGTQEELDEFITEITKMISSGEILERSRKLDFDELMETDPEYAEQLMKQLSPQSDPRKLQ
jgi:hypothetical protein